MRWSKLEVRNTSSRAIAIAAALSALAVGCSSGIDGAPTCDSKQIQVTGEVEGRTVDLHTTFSSGSLAQTKDSGSLTVALDASGTMFDMTWTPATDTGSVTTVSGSISGVPGSPICFGGDSEVLVDADQVSFHLISFHACDASSIVPGEVFGCAAVTAK
ncbi:MAG TPA: hypothetical protein VHB21_24005 [Minicystis sp.]|nr:hypothetical protein [Minicystis sp.]